MHARATPALRLLSLAVAAALACPAMAQQADTRSDAATPKAGVKTLDQITVTGSRIKRTDYEEALPVTIIQREEIEAQGITSAEQLLQQLNVASNGPDSLAANSGIAPPGTPACPAPTCAARARTRPWCCSTDAAWPRTAWPARWWT